LFSARAPVAAVPETPVEEAVLSEVLLAQAVNPRPLKRLKAMADVNRERRLRSMSGSWDMSCMKNTTNRSCGIRDEILCSSCGNRGWLVYLRAAPAGLARRAPVRVEENPGMGMGRKPNRGGKNVMMRNPISAKPKNSDHTRKDAQEIHATCCPREIPFGT
jgi:hypothetical protein